MTLNQAAADLTAAMTAAGYGTQDPTHHDRVLDEMIAAIPPSTNADLIRAAINLLNNTTGRDPIETASLAVQLSVALDHSQDSEIFARAVGLARGILGPILGPLDNQN